MSEVTDEIHDRSRPFTGAVFDTMVDRLSCPPGARGVRGRAAARARHQGGRAGDLLSRISDLTASAFRARPFLFKSALAEARDDVALAFARAWPALDANDITFGRAASAMTDAGSGSNRTWRKSSRRILSGGKFSNCPGCDGKGSGRK